MTINEDYLKNEIKRITKLYKPNKHNGFLSRNAFVNWFENQIKKQRFSCYYCETSIFNIQKLINQNKLKTRKTGTGIRGPVLEIDRMMNENGYSKDNCVLSCYYCNNDKSNTTDSGDYKDYFGANRKSYFRNLLLRNVNNS